MFRGQDRRLDLRKTPPLNLEGMGCVLLLLFGVEHLQGRTEASRLKRFEGARPLRRQRRQGRKSLDLGASAQQLGAMLRNVLVERCKSCTAIQDGRLSAPRGDGRGCGIDAGRSV